MALDKTNINEEERGILGKTWDKAKSFSASVWGWAIDLMAPVVTPVAEFAWKGLENIREWNIRGLNSGSLEYERVSEPIIPKHTAWTVIGGWFWSALWWYYDLWWDSSEREGALREADVKLYREQIMSKMTKNVEDYKNRMGYEQEAINNYSDKLEEDHKKYQSKLQEFLREKQYMSNADREARYAEITNIENDLKRRFDVLRKSSEQLQDMQDAFKTWRSLDASIVAPLFLQDEEWYTKFWRNNFKNLHYNDDGEIKEQGPVEETKNAVKKNLISATLESLGTVAEQKYIHMGVAPWEIYNDPMIQRELDKIYRIIDSVITEDTVWQFRDSAWIDFDAISEALQGNAEFLSSVKAIDDYHDAMWFEARWAAIRHKDDEWNRKLAHYFSPWSLKHDFAIWSKQLSKYISPTLTYLADTAVDNIAFWDDTDKAIKDLRFERARLSWVWDNIMWNIWWQRSFGNTLYRGILNNPTEIASVMASWHTAVFQSWRMADWLKRFETVKNSWVAKKASNILSEIVTSAPLDLVIDWLMWEWHWAANIFFNSVPWILTSASEWALALSIWKIAKEKNLTKRKELMKRELFIDVPERFLGVDGERMSKDNINSLLSYLSGFHNYLWSSESNNAIAFAQWLKYAINTKGERSRFNSLEFYRDFISKMGGISKKDSAWFVSVHREQLNAMESILGDAWDEALKLNRLKEQLSKIIDSYDERAINKFTSKKLTENITWQIMYWVAEEVARNTSLDISQVFAWLFNAAFGSWKPPTKSWIVWNFKKELALLWESKNTEEIIKKLDEDVKSLADLIVVLINNKGQHGVEVDKKISEIAKRILSKSSQGSVAEYTEQLKRIRAAIKKVWESADKDIPSKLKILKKREKELIKILLDLDSRAKDLWLDGASAGAKATGQVKKYQILEETPEQIAEKLYDKFNMALKEGLKEDYDKFIEATPADRRKMVSEAWKKALGEEDYKALWEDFFDFFATNINVPQDTVIYMLAENIKKVKSNEMKDKLAEFVGLVDDGIDVNSVIDFIGLLSSKYWGDSYREFASKWIDSTAIEKIVSRMKNVNKLEQWQADELVEWFKEINNYLAWQWVISTNKLKLQKSMWGMFTNLNPDEYWRVSILAISGNIAKMAKDIYKKVGEAQGKWLASIKSSIAELWTYFHELWHAYVNFMKPAIKERMFESIRAGVVYDKKKLNVEATLKYFKRIVENRKTFRWASNAYRIQRRASYESLLKWGDVETAIEEVFADMFRRSMIDIFTWELSWKVVWVEYGVRKTTKEVADVIDAVLLNVQDANQAVWTVNQMTDIVALAAIKWQVNNLFIASKDPNLKAAYVYKKKMREEWKKDYFSSLDFVNSFGFNNRALQSDYEKTLMYGVWDEFTTYVPWLQSVATDVAAAIEATKNEARRQWKNAEDIVAKSAVIEPVFFQNVWRRLLFEVFGGTENEKLAKNVIMESYKKAIKRESHIAHLFWGLYNGEAGELLAKKTLFDWESSWVYNLSDLFNVMSKRISGKWFDWETAWWVVFFPWLVFSKYWLQWSVNKYADWFDLFISQYKKIFEDDGLISHFGRLEDLKPLASVFGEDRLSNVYEKMVKKTWDILKKEAGNNFSTNDMIDVLHPIMYNPAEWITFAARMAKNWWATADKVADWLLFKLMERHKSNSNVAKYLWQKIMGSIEERIWKAYTKVRWFLRWAAIRNKYSNYTNEAFLRMLNKIDTAIPMDAKSFNEFLYKEMWYFTGNVMSGVNQVSKGAVDRLYSMIKQDVIDKLGTKNMDEVDEIVGKMQDAFVKIPEWSTDWEYGYADRLKNISDMVLKNDIIKSSTKERFNELLAIAQKEDWEDAKNKIMEWLEESARAYFKWSQRYSVKTMQELVTSAEHKRNLKNFVANPITIDNQVKAQYINEFIKWEWEWFENFAQLFGITKKEAEELYLNALWSPDDASKFILNNWLLTDEGKLRSIVLWAMNWDVTLNVLFKNKSLQNILKTTADKMRLSEKISSLKKYGRIEFDPNSYNLRYNINEKYFGGRKVLEWLRFWLTFWKILSSDEEMLVSWALWTHVKLYNTWFIHKPKIKTNRVLPEWIESVSIRDYLWDFREQMKLLVSKKWYESNWVVYKVDESAAKQIANEIFNSWASQKQVLDNPNYAWGSEQFLINQLFEYKDDINKFRAINNLSKMNDPTTQTLLVENAFKETFQWWINWISGNFLFYSNADIIRIRDKYKALSWNKVWTGWITDMFYRGIFSDNWTRSIWNTAIRWTVFNNFNLVAGGFSGTQQYWGNTARGIAMQKAIWVDDARLDELFDLIEKKLSYDIFNANVWDLIMGRWAGTASLDTILQYTNSLFWSDVASKRYAWKHALALWLYDKFSLYWDGALNEFVAKLKDMDAFLKDYKISPHTLWDYNYVISFLGRKLIESGDVKKLDKHLLKRVERISRFFAWEYSEFIQKTRAWLSVFYVMDNMRELASIRAAEKFRWMFGLLKWWFGTLSTYSYDILKWIRDDWVAYTISKNPAFRQMALEVAQWAKLAHSVQRMIWEEDDEGGYWRVISAITVPVVAAMMVAWGSLSKAHEEFAWQRDQWKRFGAFLDATIEFTSDIFGRAYIYPQIFISSLIRPYNTVKQFEWGTWGDGLSRYISEYIRSISTNRAFRYINNVNVQWVSSGGYVNQTWMMSAIFDSLMFAPVSLSRKEKEETVRELYRMKHQHSTDWWIIDSLKKFDIVWSTFFSNSYNVQTVLDSVNEYISDNELGVVFNKYPDMNKLASALDRADHSHLVGRAESDLWISAEELWSMWMDDILRKMDDYSREAYRPYDIVMNYMWWKSISWPFSWVQSLSKEERERQEWIAEQIASEYFELMRTHWAGEKRLYHNPVDTFNKVVYELTNRRGTSYTMWDYMSWFRSALKRELKMVIWAADEHSFSKLKMLYESWNDVPEYERYLKKLRQTERELLLDNWDMFGWELWIGYNILWEIAKKDPSYPVKFRNWQNIWSNFMAANYLNNWQKEIKQEWWLLWDAMDSVNILRIQVANSIWRGTKTSDKPKAYKSLIKNFSEQIEALNRIWNLNPSQIALWKMWLAYSIMPFVDEINTFAEEELNELFDEIWVDNIGRVLDVITDWSPVDVENAFALASWYTLSWGWSWRSGSFRLPAGEKNAKKMLKAHNDIVAFTMNLPPKAWIWKKITYNTISLPDWSLTLNIKEINVPEAPKPSKLQTIRRQPIDGTTTRSLPVSEWRILNKRSGSRAVGNTEVYWKTISL